MTGSMLVSNELGSATLVMPPEGIVPKETVEIAQFELAGWNSSRSPNEYQINFLKEYLAAAGFPVPEKEVGHIPVHNPVDLSEVEKAQLVNQIASIQNLPGETDSELAQRVQAIHQIQVPAISPTDLSTAGIAGTQAIDTLGKEETKPAPGSIHEKLAAMKSMLKSIS